MRNLRVLLMAAVLLSCLSRCKHDMELIPAGEITIYKNVKGGDALGISSSPLPVTNLVYLDKTDYVVEVVYQGERGYVRDGGFHLSRK